MLCFEGLVFFCKVGWCSSFFCNFLLKVLPPWFLLASFMVFELEIVYKGMVSTFSLVDKHFNRIALNVSLWASLLKWSSSVFERASVPVTVHIGGIRPLWQNLLTTSGWFKHARHLILFLALTPCFIGTVSMFWSFSAFEELRPCYCLQSICSSPSNALQLPKLLLDFPVSMNLVSMSNHPGLHRFQYLENCWLRCCWPTMMQ